MECEVQHPQKYVSSKQNLHQKHHPINKNALHAHCYDESLAPTAKTLSSQHTWDETIALSAEGGAGQGKVT